MSVSTNVTTGKGKNEKATTGKAGALRVTGKGKGALNKFESTGNAIGARQCFEAVKPMLKKVDNLTAFGHDNNTASIARVVDAVLIDFVNGADIDAKALIAHCFSAHTTTSRMVGKPASEQVNATYVKVISHLKGFDTSLAHHKKYLNKRMTTKGYTQAQITEICDTLYPSIAPIRANYMMAKKGAVAAAAAAAKKAAK